MEKKWIFILSLFFAGVLFGLCDAYSQICGTDDRVPSNDPAVGRLRRAFAQPVTAFILPNGKLVTAGHVFTQGGTERWVEFNVPLSTSGGDVVDSAPEDRYLIINSSIVFNSDITNGNDWAVFEVSANSETGLLPIQAQNASYSVARGRTPSTVTVTGYGLAQGPLNYTQQTHTDEFSHYDGYKLWYYTDVQSGCSGGPAIDESGIVLGVQSYGGCPNYATSVNNPAFWDAMGVKEVVIDQVLSNDNPVGTIARWMGLEFSSRFSAGTIISPGLEDHDVYQADTIIHQNEKYLRWNNESEVENYHEFYIDENADRFTANFLPTYSNIAVTTDLLDAIGTTDGNIQFRDPWYIDYRDSDFGNTPRNQGMASAEWHERDVGTVGFRPDYSTQYDGGRLYRGVFLNENPNFLPDRPNYSVGAPNPQPITVNGQSFNWYFQKWGGASAVFQDSFVPQTPVVFTNAGATATAIYKAQFGSSSSNATGLSSQRKILRDENGYYHVAYESANHIWYTRSTNGGITWLPEVKVSSDNEVQLGLTNRNPSVSLRYNPSQRVMIIWEAQVYDPGGSINLVFINSIDPTTLQPEEVYELASIQSYPGINFSTMPSVSTSNNPGPNSLLAVWYNATQPGIMGNVWDSTLITNGPWEWLLEPELLRQGTITALTMASNANEVNRQPWEIAWVEANILYYGTIAVEEIPVMSSPEVVISGGGNTYEPSIVNVGPWPGIAWYDDGQASGTSPNAGGSPASIRYRERNSTGWAGPLTIWADTYGGVSSPNVTYNDGSGTVDVFWRGGTQIRHAQRTASGWGGVSAVTTGVAPMASVAVPGDLGGSSEILLSRGSTIPYPIQRNTITYGAGESERPTIATADSIVYEGRGGTLSFPTGEMHIAITQASHDGESLSYYRMSDTVETVRRLKFEEATTSTPFPGIGRLQFDLLYKETGELPSNGRFNIVLRDGATNQVLRTIRSFGGVQDTTITENISLDYPGRRVNLGISAVNFPNSTRYTLERWFFGEDSGEVRIAKVSVQENSATVGQNLPSVYALHPNHPNPFNPSTQIRFDLPEASNVTLVIYDILGRQVTKLVKGEYEAGYHSVTWNASSFASGIYLARFVASNANGVVKLSTTQKLVLAK